MTGNIMSAEWTYPGVRCSGMGGSWNKPLFGPAVPGHGRTRALSLQPGLDQQLSTWPADRHEVYNPMCCKAWESWLERHTHWANIFSPSPLYIGTKSLCTLFFLKCPSFSCGVGICNQWMHSLIARVVYVALKISSMFLINALISLKSQYKGKIAAKKKASVGIVFINVHHCALKQI